MLLTKQKKALKAKKDLIVYCLFKEITDEKGKVTLYSEDMKELPLKNNKYLKAKFIPYNPYCYDDKKSYREKMYSWRHFKIACPHKNNKGLYVIGIGFIDSYISVDWAKKRIPYYEISAIYKCLIPKGTYYYEGLDGGLASRKIKILEKVA